MKSLRAKMTILIVMVVLGSSVLMSLNSYQRAKSSLIVQLEDNYMASAQKNALELTAWVNTNATIIDTLAAEIAVNDITLKDYDAFHSYLQHSNELLNKNGYVYDVYFTYPNNFMVCASDFVADGTVDFVHEREWYTTSALTGELYFSAPYLDSDTNQSVITISKAVYKDNELLGVLAADIFVDVLIDMVYNADVGNESYAFLMDQNMRMLAHPNEFYKYDSTPLKVMDDPASPYGPLVDVIQNGYDKMVFVDDYDGINRGISTARMTNTGWYVCIATSRDEISKGVGGLLRGFVISTIISIVIGVFIAIFLARVLDKLTRQEQEYRQQVLRLEKQAADEASRAKSRFLADMSHEIRTPINAIIGMNEMILRETDNGDIREYSRNIRQSGHNLLQLINGILDFSKIEDGKMEIVPVRYRVGSQVAYLLNSISDRANAKKLKLEFNIDPQLPTQLYGDDTRINQVIVNLLTNAVKYTEKGTVSFSIQTKEKKDGRILIYFEVKDTGIGIQEEDMAKLFESFERLDVVRNRNIEGTGLGMTITRKLLDLMDSELKVESVYGKGSVFSFELWQEIADESPLGDYREYSEGGSDEGSYQESFHAERARILVVDDTKMNLFVVQSLLKKTGIKIDTAGSGPDSIRLSEENVYDVILMDQRMPGMDGTQAMKLIREQEGGKNAKTPVICLTADVIRGARDRYLKQGFDDYLTKPIDGAELEKMLMTYLPEDKLERITGLPDKEIGNKADAAAKDNSEITDPEKDNVMKDLLKALTGIGVNTDTGISHSANDKEVYRSVLSTFAGEEKEKARSLQNSYEKEDWDNYGITVHSLKSSAGMIGAAGLSSLAAGLESAAQNNDKAAIDKDHERVKELYEQLTAVIDDHLIDEDKGMDEEDGDDVLEFTPK